MINEDTKKAQNQFQKEKIIQLNKFFMKSVIRGLVLLFFTFTVSTGLLITIIKISDVDQTLKISLISMVATYILTMSKTMIDRIITIITFLFQLLSAEQRGLNKNIGIEIEEIKFENDQNNTDQ